MNSHQIAIIRSDGFRHRDLALMERGQDPCRNWTSPLIQDVSPFQDFVVLGLRQLAACSLILVTGMVDLYLHAAQSLGYTA